MVRPRSAIEDMPRYLQEAASVLEEKLEDFARPGAGEASESLRRILDRASKLLLIPRDDQPASSSGRHGAATEGQICRHKCEHHEELMDPSRWGKLSKSIVFEIFARLPVSKIIGLQVMMSHHRKAAFARRQVNDEDNDDDDDEDDENDDNASLPPHSDFLQLCDEVHPKLALITRDKENKFWIRLLDVRFNAWHAFQISAGDAHAVDITAASEANGLVCFISSLRKSKSRSFVVDIVNSLTHHSCALPALHDLSIVQMAQIIVNPDTKAYKVLIVGEEATTGHRVAKLYDPAVSTDKWLPRPKQQKLIVFGYAYHWGNFRYSQKRDTPCAYDFTSKRLRTLKEGSPLESPTVRNFALLNDRLFVLRRDREGPSNGAAPHYNRSPAYYIVEFRAKLTAKSFEPNSPRAPSEWAKVASHRCKPFELPPRAKFELSLFACEGFLVVMARLAEEEPYRIEVGWLYNLATRAWSELPSLPGGKPYRVDDLLCRLHWNVSV